MSSEMFRNADSEISLKLSDVKNSFNPDERIGDIVQKGSNELKHSESEAPDKLSGSEISEVKGNDLPEQKYTDNNKISNNEIKSADKPIRKIDTINQALEGKNHPDTGVSFERKTVELADEMVEGVFPVFDSAFDTYLPSDKYKANDTVQFKYCVESLRESIEKDPSLAERFTEVQLEQIKNGEPRIKGLTWHHSEELGKMQLVDSEIHAKTNHTGGAAIWGGRNE